MTLVLSLCATGGLFLTAGRRETTLLDVVQIVGLLAYSLLRLGRVLGPPPR